MDISEIFDTLEKYSVVIGKTSYPPLLFIWVSLFLFFIFLTRVLILIRSNRKYKRETNRWQLIGNQSLNYVFSIIVSFTLTCVFENNDNYVLNGLICPAIGFLSSFTFDEKVIKKYISKTDTQSETDEKSKSNNKPKTVNLQPKFSDYIKKPNESDFISNEDTLNEDYNIILKDKINNLIESRYIEAKEIDDINKELKTQTGILNAMRETMKDDKKLKLERMIYDCLNQGYAKPEQNKIITTNYKNYRSLNGNGEIEELYENHYLKLDVHEDRRTSNRNNQPQYQLAPKIFEHYTVDEHGDYILVEDPITFSNR